MRWFIWLSFLAAFVCGQSQVPPGCEVTTTTGYRYSQFHHLHSNPDGTMELRFRVMAKSDAHVALTTSPLILNPLYEIVIGASGNNYTDLRRTMTGRSVSAVKTPSLLSDSEFRGFWIIVRQGEIEVGREGETLPYFHWKDPDPLPVHYYSLSSWTSTVAKWIQKCNFGGPTSWLTPADNSSSEDSAGLPPNDDSYFNAEEKLKANLLRTYNKDVRPSAYHFSPVTLTLRMYLNHFDLSEITSTIGVHALFRMAWRDERLQWNVSDYENVTTLHLPTHAVWQPDLKLYNSASASDMIHFAETNLLVYPDGAVVSLPPASFDSLCRLDLRMWPWDYQTCTLVIGSWTHDGYGIDLKLSEGNQTEMNNIETQDLFTTNLHWELLSTEANINVTVYECCPESYPAAHFTLNIRRRSPLYRASVTIPAIMISMLTLVAFILPPNSTEKISIHLVNFLVLSIFLIYFSSILPPLGDHMPLIVSFFSNTLVLVGVSLLLAVITITMTRTPIMFGPPYPIKNILTGFTGKLLCLGPIISLVNKSGSDEGSSRHQRMDDYTVHVDGDQHDASLVASASSTRDLRKIGCFRGVAEAMNLAELEWLLVAYALDRLAIIAYFIVIAIMMTVCF